MFAFKEEYRQKVKEFIHTYLESKRQDLSIINGWGSDFIDRMQEFVGKGKLVRSSLLLFTYESLGSRQIHQDVIALASSLEILHSALLIHDDIIDRDTLRRGKATLWKQYADKAKSEGIEESEHLGKSLAICAGDLGVFLCYDILNSIDFECNMRQQIISLWTKECLRVGVAHMHDMYLGFSPQRTTLDNIMHLYKYKTACYSFCLPLALGAILANKRTSIMEALNELGHLFGILFQIKDDELGISGDQDATGKNVGSDIEEGKQTPYFLNLYDVMSEDEKVALDAAIKSQDENLLSLYKELLAKYNVQEKINALVIEKEQEALTIIETLDVPEEYKAGLKELIMYVMKREK